MSTPAVAAPEYPIRVPVKWLPLANWAAIVFLLAAHLAIWTYHYRVHPLPDYLTELFDVEEEQSLENAYSSFALAIAGGLTLAMAGRRRQDADRDARYWKVLGIGLCAMSLEEVAGVHETINTWQGGGWTTWGMVVAALIGLWFVPFLIRLPARTRWLFLAAGACYVGGEMVVQKFEEIFYAQLGAGESLPYKFAVAVKEGGEMIGVVIYMQALLAHMSAGRPSVVVDVQPRR